MSLPASSYTPPGGGTVIGQQTAQNMPNSSNTQAPPNPLTSDASSFPSDTALNAQAATANANLVPFGTSAGRQQYLDNSNLGAMQTNYDDLARRLFEYDQGTLNPQFQGQNPGLPSDAASFGRVDASPLAMTVNGAGLPAEKGLSITGSNPKYAYAAQTAQGNSLLDLLDTLNKGVSGTFAARTGTYRSDKQAAQDALDTVMKVMGMKSDVAFKQAELQNSRDIEGMRLKSERDLKMLELGYATIDDKGNIVPVKGGTSGVVDLSSAKSKADQASALRSAYTSSLSIGEKKRISDQAKQMGISLTPKDLSPKSTDDLNSDITMMGKIQNIIDVMNQYGDKFPTGPSADISSFLSKIGAGEMLGGKADINQALADLGQIRVYQEKLLGGIRAAGSPQMYQKLAASTPGISRSTTDNKLLLNSLLQAAQYHIQLIARQNQYADAQDMANNMGISIPTIGASSSSPSTNRQQIVNTLKSAGKSDDQIHEYLRLKGIDN